MFLEDTIAKYTMADNNKFKTIIAFDCRGMEPVEFSPRNGWKVCGFKEDADSDGEGDEVDGKVTGTEFTDIDLADLEWADYDERSNESTMITGIVLIILVESFLSRSLYLHIILEILKVYVDKNSTS